MLQSVLLLVLTLFEWSNAIAPGQLNIRLDQELAAQYTYVYKSYVVFNENVQTDWTPEQFVGLVYQAHADMVTAWKADTADMSSSRAADDRLPRVMSAIAIGNTVSFSSSAKSKGKSFFYDPTKNGKFELAVPTVLSAKANQCLAMAQALRRCSTTAPGDDKHLMHMSGANCGEEWAMCQYCLEHPDADFKGARILAWELKPANKYGPEKRQIKPPCGIEGAANFGCSRLVQELELDVIPVNTRSDITRDPGHISCTWPSFCNAIST